MMAITSWKSWRPLRISWCCLLFVEHLSCIAWCFLLFVEPLPCFLVLLARCGILVVYCLVLFVVVEQFLCLSWCCLLIVEHLSSIAWCCSLVVEDLLCIAWCCLLIVKHLSCFAWCCLLVVEQLSCISWCCFLVVEHFFCIAWGHSGARSKKIGIGGLCHSDRGGYKPLNAGPHYYPIFLLMNQPTQELCLMVTTNILISQVGVGAWLECYGCHLGVSMGRVGPGLAWFASMWEVE